MNNAVLSKIKIAKLQNVCLYNYFLQNRMNKIHAGQFLPLQEINRLGKIIINRFFVQ